jgi:hypothetical protein
LECVDGAGVGSIKMGLRVIGFVGVDWIPLAENNSGVKSCFEYGNALLFNNQQDALIIPILFCYKTPS